MSSIRCAIVIAALAWAGMGNNYAQSAAQQKGTPNRAAVQVGDQAAMSGHAIPSSALASLQHAAGLFSARSAVSEIRPGPVCFTFVL